MKLDGFCDVLEKEKLIVVVRGKSIEEAINVARSCIFGGIKLIEVTFTVPNAEEVIKSVKKEFLNSDVLIGAGTVLDLATVRKAIDSGAEFIVSPNLDLELMQFVLSKNVAYIPGVFSASELANAVNGGAKAIKLFPGDVIKPTGLKALLGPFPFAKLMPTGGVSYDNLEDWFNAGAFAVGAGGNLTKNAKTGDFDLVKAEAEKWVKKIKEIGA